MKTIWFDVGHPAQLNFYLNAIKSLCFDYNVILTVIARGRLPKIVKKELEGLPNTKVLVIGKHKGNRLSAFIDANIIRLLLLFFVCLKNRVHLHFSNGYQGSLLSKIFGFSAVTFGDDPRSLDYKLKLAFADQVYFCLFSEEFIRLHSKAKILRTVKEWAYLNPIYFRANKTELLKYGLEPYRYFFIREVSTGTINYAGQKSGIIKELADKIPAEYRVLFSLEDKSKRQLYPKDWILLQEPVEDIHSLIYFSRALISSGDSMAREAAVLGIPSFYVGNRTMAANEVLKKLVDFFQVDVKNFQTVFGDHTQSFTESDQLKNIEILKNKFIDINDFIKNTAKKILESN